MSVVTDCLDCPLRRKPLFVPLSKEEIAFMRRFKSGEIDVPQGQDVMSQGQKSPVLQTVLSGMAVRSLLLEDGRRQVINFVFPGDLVGLHSGLMGEARHSITAVTDMTLCTFPRGRIWNLFVKQPERAYDVTWMAAVEQHFLGETIATLGQRDATERVAWALVRIWRRLVALGMERHGAVPFPFRQQDLADALGLSIVHTNRRIVALRQAKLAEISARRLVMHDHAGLSLLAHLDMDRDDVRPIL
ncbi:Crp/Fnr family transcriptional regulator [Tabrizicola sp.]|uniref:Crp/Fnr family transcriptional regulator n=1 Tax=Tabrizicola sp. TaxID=2005166 RepID=UPI001A471EFA|nr:Crp/Fnr family transcriptional regulator [Tabrizicola sp.]MBL9072775.1 Crp/Fnr family transcriptional regulator [Tabrizicola sp.]